MIRGSTSDMHHVGVRMLVLNGVAGAPADVQGGAGRAEGGHHHRCHRVQNGGEPLLRIMGHQDRGAERLGDDMAKEGPKDGARSTMSCRFAALGLLENFVCSTHWPPHTLGCARHQLPVNGTSACDHNGGPGTSDRDPFEPSTIAITCAHLDMNQGVHASRAMRGRH